MQFSVEIWRRSEYIQALGDFSKLIGEKSPIRRQKVNFYEFQKKPVYPHPSNPPPDNSLLHSQSLEINTKGDEFPRSP